MHMIMTSITITIAARDLELPEFCFFCQDETSCFFRRDGMPAPIRSGDFVLNIVFGEPAPRHPHVPAVFCLCPGGAPGVFTFLEISSI